MISAQLLLVCQTSVFFNADFGASKFHGSSETTGYVHVGLDNFVLYGGRKTCLGQNANGFLVSW